MYKKVKKSKALQGEIIIPADKSISHRAVMLASLAEGRTLITNFSSGADCHSTLELFKKLGVNIKEIEDKTIEIISDGTLQKPDLPLDCGNSGTTMRLLSGILAGQNFDSILTGDASLSKRPMKRIIDPLSQMGAQIFSTSGYAPLIIKGQPLHGIEYTSELSSAQVKSAILLAGLKAEGGTVYRESFSSRNHTELMLKYLGADINFSDGFAEIKPSALSARDIEIAGDISSAAFFIAAALIIPDSHIVIKNVGLNPTRTGILDIVLRMGAGVNILNRRTLSGEEIGDIEVSYTDNLKSCEIKGGDIPRLIDELPVIAVVASQTDGETVISNAEDLRNKESDRIECLVRELCKIGVNIEETPDGFIVHGRTKLEGGAELETYHDHRLAMSFYVAGLICEKDILVNGFEWIRISFPEFDTLMERLTI